jgi:Uma2 family endonuclease
MAAMVSTPTPASTPPGEYVPTADQRIVMRGLDWAGFQTLLTLRGERAIPRMAYLDGVVELMGPSRGHEGRKSNLGRLVEAYCLRRDLPISPYGSWHLEDETDEAGAEPDECYVFGPDPRSKDRPDLVIEVVWTRGGINKLEIYRRLGIAEVWFWMDDRISVHVLGLNGYQVSARSVCLPDLDLPLVCEHLVVEPLNEAVKQFLAALDRP